jgi:hypothetical protein
MGRKISRHIQNHFNTRFKPSNSQNVWVFGLWRYCFKTHPNYQYIDIPVGRFRDLTDAEIKELNELIEPSSKTEEASLPKPEKLKLLKELNL